MDKLRIGVVGVGNMGRNHVRILSAENRFELVGIHDSDQSLAEKLAVRFDTRSFGRVEELMESIDAVVIAVPSVYHCEMAMKAADQGVHALIEKPIATSVADAEEIDNRFAEAGLKLAIGHVERFNPVYRELRKIVMDEEILYVEACRYSPFSGSGRITDVSVVEDLMIHDVDLVCDLFAPLAPQTIDGKCESLMTDYPDIATCMLGFERGYAVITASRVSQEKERHITVHTKKGCFKADLFNKTLEVSRDTNMEIDLAGDSSYIQQSSVQKIYIPIEEPLRVELLSFYDSIVNEQPIEVDGGMGIEALKICETVAKKATGGMNK